MRRTMNSCVPSVKRDLNSPISLPIVRPWRIRLIPLSFYIHDCVSNACAQPCRSDTHQSLSRPCTDLVDKISAEQYIFVSTTESTVSIVYIPHFSKIVPGLRSKTTAMVMLKRRCNPTDPIYNVLRECVYICFRFRYSLQDTWI